MYVKAIELINIRGYKKQTVELAKGINLLIGANNSGKTTILKALYTLQSVNAIGVEDIRKSTSHCYVNINIEDIEGFERNLFYHHKVENSRVAESDKQNVIFYLGKALESITTERLYYDTTSTKEKKESSGRVKIYYPDGREKPFNNFPLFSSNESHDNFIFPFFAKRKSSYYSNQIGGEAADEVNESFSNLPARIQKIGATAHPAFEKFKEYCTDILGFDISAIAGSNNGEGQKIGIYATNKDRIFIEAMGEGVANILALISIILTEDNKLFLIEELENDIHPAALKKILNLIVEKSKSNQFVISTHSNIVLKYLGGQENTKIFFTEWSNQDTENPGAKLKIPTSTITEIENTPAKRLQILESLGYDFFDFDLYSAYILFEESSAEKIVRDILIPYLSPALIGKIRTIAAKGADDLSPKFNDMQRLFLYLHNDPIYEKRVWVIADGDQAGADNIEKLQNDFKSWPAEHFIKLSKRDFEYYYPQRFQQKVLNILEIENKKERRRLKKELVLEVFEWASQNIAEATAEFAESAKEILTILNLVSERLNSCK